MATVGLSTFSITRLNGSVTPLSRSASRCSMTGSNLQKRSLIICPRHSRGRGNPVFLGWAGSQPSRGRRIKKLSRLELLQRVDELADALDLRLQVHRNEDVELVL